MRVAAGIGLGKLESARSKRKWISQAGHTQEVWTDLSKSKTDWSALFTAPWVMASRTKNAYNGNGMDLRQQGQEWGRKKKGKWMCMPTVAFEVP